jgi:hypothetical protein
MVSWIEHLDRRWVFLMMALAVGVPVLLQQTFPEAVSPLAQSAFDELDQLPSGSKVLLSFDYDPGSEGELGPMATSFVHQCAEKGHKMYFMTLFPVGSQMITETIDSVIRDFYPNLEYGVDFVDLGFKAGNEAVIKTIATDLVQYYTTDSRGTAISKIPMMNGVGSLSDFDVLVNVSAGYPGCKEWVLYAATPLDKPLLVGCTGVSTPQMYPYYPNQVQGLLGAIKGAAEYEFIVNTWARTEQMRKAIQSGGASPSRAGELMEDFSASGDTASAWVEGVDITPEARAEFVAVADAKPPGPFTEALRRMSPQLVGHLLMIVLILMGNVVYFAARKRGGAA